MPTVSSIRVLLIAQTKAFEKGMRRAAFSVQSLSGGIASFVGKLAGFGGALTGVAGVAGLGALTKSQSEAMDAAARLAERIGVSTEALEGWRLAAREAGEGAEALDGALEQFVRRLGTASDEIANAFGRIGLVQDDLRRAGPEEAFLRTVDALSRISDPATRAARAFELFGKQSRGILNIVTSGRAALQGFERDAERLGLTFSSIDARQVDAAGDAFSRIGELVTGIGRTMAIQLAPIIEHVSNSFVQWATTGSGVTAKIIIGIQAVVEAVAHLVQFVDWLRGAWQATKATVLAFASAAVAAASSVLRVFESINDFIGGANRWRPDDTIIALENAAAQLYLDAEAAADEAEDSFQQFNSNIRVDRVRDFFEEIQNQARAAAQAMEAVAVGPPAPVFDSDLFDAQVRDLERLGDVAKRIAEGVQTPWEKYGETMDEIIETFAKGLIDQETFFRATEKAQKDLAAIDTEREDNKALGQVVHRGFNAPGGVADVGRRQREVRDPQLVQTNRLLADIRNRVGGPTVAIAG